MLIARGVAKRRRVGAGADVRLSESMQAAKTHADQAVAKSEEKADAKFVSKRGFMSWTSATRGDRDALGPEFVALRREIKITQRIWIGLSIEFVVLATLILVNGV